MDDDDFLALIALVQEELRNSGAGEIASDRHYVLEDADTGEPRLPPSEKHLIELLEAFGRHMAVRDRQTYSLALDGINRHLAGRTLVTGAVVVRTRGETVRDPIDLTGAPNLAEPRKALQRLIGNLREPPTGRALT